MPFSIGEGCGSVDGHRVACASDWHEECDGLSLEMDLDGRHHFAEVEGCRLHWVELGESTSKTPVLLLHGLNDCYLTWKNLAPTLMRERRVFVLDLPGHGLSGRPDASYELRWYARITARWLETLGLDTVDVVGHSFGGGVAQVMLLECPQVIRRMVLVSTGGLGREIAVALRLASIPGVIERFGQPFMGFGTRIALKATGGLLSKEEVARLSAMNARSGSARAFARTVHDIIDWRGQRHSFFKRANELARLPSIAVFWGDRDTIIPPAHAQALADCLDGIRVKLFVGCGHYPHQEQSGAFGEAVRDFLDDPTVAEARLRDLWAEKPSQSKLLANWVSASRDRLFGHRRNDRLAVSKTPAGDRAEQEAPRAAPSSPRPPDSVGAVS